MVHLQMKNEITKCYSGTLILWYSFDWRKTACARRRSAEHMVTIPGDGDEGPQPARRPSRTEKTA